MGTRIVSGDTSISWRTFAGFVALISTLLLAAMTSAATAADKVENPGQVTFNIKAGKLVTPPDDFDLSDPSKDLLNEIPFDNEGLKLVGTSSADGALTFPKQTMPKFTYEAVVSGIPLALDVALATTKTSVGTIDPQTGAVSVPLELTADITGEFSGLAVGCRIGPIAAGALTSSHALGAAYGWKTSGSLSVGATDFAIPAATDITGTEAGASICDLANSSFNLPASSETALVLIGTLAKAPLPPGATPPPLLSVQKGGIRLSDNYAHSIEPAQKFKLDATVADDGKSFTVVDKPLIGTAKYHEIDVAYRLLPTGQSFDPKRGAIKISAFVVADFHAPTGELCRSTSIDRTELSTETPGGDRLSKSGYAMLATPSKDSSGAFSMSKAIAANHDPDAEKFCGALSKTLHLGDKLKGSLSLGGVVAGLELDPSTPVDPGKPDPGTGTPNPGTGSTDGDGPGTPAEPGDASQKPVGNPGPLTMRVLEGSLSIGTTVVDKPIPAGADPLTLSGSVDADGNLNFPLSGSSSKQFTIESASLPMPIPVRIVPATDASGLIVPGAGLAAIKLGFRIAINAPPLLACEFPGDGSIDLMATATDYVPSTGIATLTSEPVAIPGLGSACGGLAGVANSSLGLPGTGGLKLKVQFTPAPQAPGFVPGGNGGVDANSAFSASFSRKARVKGMKLPVVVTCKAATAQRCAGKVALGGKVSYRTRGGKRRKLAVKAAANYAVAGGKKKTYNLELSRTALRALQSSKRASLTLTNSPAKLAGATTAAKPSRSKLTVLAPSKNRR